MPAQEDERRAVAKGPVDRAVLLDAGSEGALAVSGTQKPPATSAVLAPLYAHPGSGSFSGFGDLAHVVLTRRAKGMRQHSGEVSFPGGRRDPGEELWQTALREANEEIALDPSIVRRIGELDHLRTVTSRAWIVPYVGELVLPQPMKPVLVPSPAEVAHVLHMSLAELLEPEIFFEELWTFGEVTRPVFFFEVEGDTIWGATAAMLRNLLSIVTGTHNKTTRIAHWDSPEAVLEGAPGAVSQLFMGE